MTRLGKALRRPIRAAARVLIIPLAVLLWVPVLLIAREIFNAG